MKFSRWAAPAALSIAVAGVPLAFPSLAEAVTGTDSFTVYVTDLTTGADLSGESVTLYSATTGTAVGTAKTTDSGGFVTFEGLSDGSYTAKVAANAKYHERYSTVETVDAGDPGFAFVSVAPTGPSTGRLTGTVTETMPKNRSLESVIEIFPASATEASIESGSVAPVAQTEAYDYDYSGGAQSAPWSSNLPAGQYKVEVSDQASDSSVHYDYDTGNEWREYSNHVWVGAPSTANDIDDAATFTVTTGKATATGTTRLTYQPDSGSTQPARISGTVTGAGGIKLGSTDYSYVDVDLLQQQGDGSWRDITSTSTNEDGTFDFATIYDDYTGEDDPIPAGTYTLRFADESGEYKPEFLGHVDASESWAPTADQHPTTFTLGSSDSVVENEQMTQAPLNISSGVHGKVTDDTGAAHAGILTIFDAYGNQVLRQAGHRDGNWSLSTADLAPGQYKIEVQDDSDIAGWYGGKTFKTAKLVTVPVTGATNVGNSNLARYATIGGKVSLPAVAGTDEAFADITLYDAAGDPVDSTSSSDGTYKFTEEPGTYYVKAAGYRDSAFDESGVGVSEVDFVPQFFSGKYSLDTATPIAVRSGGKATANITLGRTLAATSAARIAGTPAVGATLKASAGTWNVRHDVSYTYVWSTGSTVLSRSASYKVASTLSDKTVTLTVTATDTADGYLAGRSTANVHVAKVVTKPATKHTKPKKHRKHGKAKKHKKHGKGKTSKK